VRSKDHFNDKKCAGKFRETGTYIISAGTDAYAGITGSGNYTAVGSIANGCVGTPTGLKAPGRPPSHGSARAFSSNYASAPPAVDRADSLA
jgi:hypothetical protein